MWSIKQRLAIRWSVALIDIAIGLTIAFLIAALAGAAF